MTTLGHYCLADATAQSTGNGVSTRVHGAGGQDRRESVPVLQCGAPASHCRVAGAGPFTGARLPREAQNSGSAVRRRRAQSLGSGRKWLGVVLRAVLDRPRCGSAMRLDNDIVQGPMLVRHDVDWLKSDQARS